MLKSAINYIASFLEKGHERTVLIKKNVFISLTFRGASICISLILVPMTIKYISAPQYGIWITLSSLINWFNFFDIGLGNGLRNNIAISNAQNEPNKAKIYISTAYTILAFISSVIFAIFFVSNHYLNWNKILNTSKNSDTDLSLIALIIVGSFCFQFVIQTINNVLTACQASGKASFVNFISQATVLAAILLLTFFTKGKLLYLTIALACTPIVIQFIASVYFYLGSYKFLAPSIQSVDFKYVNRLFSTAGVFFIIQIGGLILFETDNLIIIQVLGPRDVTVFNLSNKLFSVVTMVFTIFMTPFWSAFTDAYTKGDMTWVKQVIRKIYKYFTIVICFCIFLLFASPVIFRMWIGNAVHIPYTLSAAMTLYTIGFCWLTITCFFLNGIGKIRLQMYLYIICMLTNIPLSIWGAKTIGIAGVTLANVLIFLLMSVVLSIQTEKIINKTAIGIWDK